MSKKNFSCKFQSLLMAATVGASLGTLSAQDNALQADVPFAFSISRDVSLPAGRYIVSHSDHILKFQNSETGQGVSSVVTIAREGRRDEKPSLTFRCRGSNCQLDTVRAGGENTGVEIPTYKQSKPEQEEARVVNLPLVAKASR